MTRQCLNCVLNRSAHVRYGVSSQHVPPRTGLYRPRFLSHAKVAANLLANLTKPDYVSRCQRGVGGGEKAELSGRETDY